MNKQLFRKSIADLTELVGSTELPFIAKGIMSVEDALGAVDAGVAGIDVSNHGGRALESTRGVAEVLPEIVDVVPENITVTAGGGVRTGYDVLKMLALGADAVLIGRDIVRAAVGAGILGVRLQMEYLQNILAKAMKMTGVKSLAEITPDILV